MASMAVMGDSWGNGFPFSQYGKGLSVDREGKFSGAPPQQAIEQVQRLYYDSRNRPPGTLTNDFQIYLPKYATGGVLSVELVEFFFPVPPGTPPDYINLCIDKMSVMRELEPDSFTSMQVMNNFDSSYTTSWQVGQMSGPPVEHTPQSGVTLQVELSPIVTPAGTVDTWCKWKMGKGQRSIVFFPKEDISRMRVQIKDYKGNLVQFSPTQYVRLILEVNHK